jgi:hypothetical protein
VRTVVCREPVVDRPGEELVAADAKQATRPRNGVDALTFVVGEKHGGPRRAQERSQFRHGQYNTAIAVAATGVAAITVALGSFNGGEGN